MKSRRQFPAPQRWLRSAVAVLIVLATAASPMSARAAGPGWYSSWSSAQAAACSGCRPLVVVFESDGCPDCERMSQTLSSSGGRSALRSAVKLRLNFSANSELAARYGVSLTPTTIVFDIAGGELNEVYRQTGSMSVSQLREVGKSITALASANKKPEKPAAEKPARREQASAKQPKQADREIRQTAPTQQQQVASAQQQQQVAPAQQQQQVAQAQPQLAQQIAHGTQGSFASRVYYQREAASQPPQQPAYNPPAQQPAYSPPAQQPAYNPPAQQVAQAAPRQAARKSTPARKSTQRAQQQAQQQSQRQRQPQAQPQPQPQPQPHPQQAYAYYPYPQVPVHPAHVPRAPAREILDNFYSGYSYNEPHYQHYALYVR